MLSGESAKGEYPLESVMTMAKIQLEAESAIWHQNVFRELFASQSAIVATHSTAISAVEESNKANASAIICLTMSGRTAHLISKYRPKCPIIAVTRNEQTARQCNLFRGIIPLPYSQPTIDDWIKDVDARICYAVNYGKTRGFIKTGNRIVIVTGWKSGSGFTNTIRIVTCN